MQLTMDSSAWFDEVPMAPLRAGSSWQSVDPSFPAHSSLCTGNAESTAYPRSTRNEGLTSAPPGLDSVESHFPST